MKENRENNNHTLIKHWRVDCYLTRNHFPSRYINISAECLFALCVCIILETDVMCVCGVLETDVMCVCAAVWPPPACHIPAAWWHRPRWGRQYLSRWALSAPLMVSRSRVSPPSSLSHTHTHTVRQNTVAALPVGCYDVLQNEGNLLSRYKGDLHYLGRPLKTVLLLRFYY